MTLDELRALASSAPRMVILLEGKRSISEEDAAKARRLGEFLATEFPAAVFRSGNADGSDQAFCDGVAAVNPAKLQIVAPYRGHRAKSQFAGAAYLSREELSPAEIDAIVKVAAKIDSKHGKMREQMDCRGRVAAAISYLFRDTLKVVGRPPDFPRPTLAIFHVNPDNPLDGGTGYTIRVCRQQKVPCVFQNTWHQWMP